MVWRGGGDYSGGLREKLSLICDGIRTGLLKLLGVFLRVVFRFATVSFRLIASSIFTPRVSLIEKFPFMRKLLLD